MKREGKKRLVPRDPDIKEMLGLVYRVMDAQGDMAEVQIAEYLESGDPVYITRKEGARKTIQEFDRSEILEELVRYYVGDIITQMPQGERRLL